jgi:hypothetical protein
VVEDAFGLESFELVQEGVLAFGQVGSVAGIEGRRGQRWVYKISHLIVGLGLIHIE